MDWMGFIEETDVESIKSVWYYLYKLNLKVEDYYENCVFLYSCTWTYKGLKFNDKRWQKKVISKE